MDKLIQTATFFIKHLIFKDNSETDINSHKFDAIKVSIFLFLILACVFNMYAIIYMAKQAEQIVNLRGHLKAEETIVECIKVFDIDYKEKISLDIRKEGEFIMGVRKCIVVGEQDWHHK